jgi:hypothetical protein
MNKENKETLDLSRAMVEITAHNYDHLNKCEALLEIMESIGLKEWDKYQESIELLNEKGW